MKKILLSLMACSLTVSATSIVLSCANSANLYTPTLFSEKMDTLNHLDTQKLINSGIKIHTKYTKEVIKSFTDGIINDSDDIKNPILINKLKINMPVILLANEFLFNVAKIPGYHWINEKLRTQDTEFNLFNKNSWKTDGIYNSLDLFSRFISSWMSNLNDWGISVTFFNGPEPDSDDDNPIPSTLTPWSDQFSAPNYARININQKVISYKGLVIPSESNQNAVHYDKNDIPYTVDNRILNSSNGSIYQGWLMSSKILNLHEIQYDEDANATNIDFLSFTPSAIDLVNNQISPAEINSIVKSFHNDFAMGMDQSLTDNPVYLGDGVVGDDVKTRLTNIAFITLFGILETRRDMTDPKWSKIYHDIPDMDPNHPEEKIGGFTLFSDTAWEDIQILFDKIDNIKNEITDPKVWLKVSQDIQNLSNTKTSDYGDSNITNSLPSESASESVNQLTEILQLTRKYLNNNSYEESLLSNSHLINVIGAFYQRANDFQNMYLIDDSIKTDLTKFGNNNEYMFGEFIYGTLDDTKKMNQDDFLKKYGDQLFYDTQVNGANSGDRWFRNISITERFSSNIDSKPALFKLYTKTINHYYENWLEDADPYAFTGAGPISVTGAINAANKWGYGDNVANPTSGWFEDSRTGYLDRLGIKGGEDLTIAKMAVTFDSALRYVLRKLITFDVTTQSIPIWNISNKGEWAVSSDFAFDKVKKGAISNPSQYDRDDDMAFSDLMGLNNTENNTFYPTEFSLGANHNITSDFRSLLFNYGYEDRIDGKVNVIKFSNVHSEVNSFGEATSEPITWLGLKEHKSYLLDATQSTMFIQTNYVNNKDDSQFYSSYTDALPKYYDYWVRCNPKKSAEDGYNKDAVCK